MPFEFSSESSSNAVELRAIATEEKAVSYRSVLVAGGEEVARAEREEGNGAGVEVEEDELEEEEEDEEEEQNDSGTVREVRRCGRMPRFSAKTRSLSVMNSCKASRILSPMFGMKDIDESHIMKRAQHPFGGRGGDPLEADVGKDAYAVEMGGPAG